MNDKINKCPIERPRRHESDAAGKSRWNRHLALPHSGFVIDSSFGFCHFNVRVHSWLNVRGFHERTSQTLSIRSDRAEMAKNLGRAAAFSRPKSRRKTFRSEKAEILHPRHVPLSQRSWPARRPS